MKSKTAPLFIATVALACLPFAVANDKDSSDASVTVTTKDHSDMKHHWRHDQRGSTLRHWVGKDVKNEAGEKIGSVKDFALDSDSGRIVYVIVSSGGVMGMGDKLYAVPPGAFNRERDDAHRRHMEGEATVKTSGATTVTTDTTKNGPDYVGGETSATASPTTSADMNAQGELKSGNVAVTDKGAVRTEHRKWGHDERWADWDNGFVLSVDSSRWQSAPMVTEKDLDSLNTDARRKEIYTYYNAKWENERPRHWFHREKKADTESHLVLATKIKGKDLMNGDQKIAAIDDVIVEHGHWVCLLVDPKGNVPNTEGKYVVGFNHINGATDKNGNLMTGLTADDFVNAAPVDGKKVDHRKVKVYRWDSNRHDWSDHDNDDAND